MDAAFSEGSHAAGQQMRAESQVLEQSQNDGLQKLKDTIFASRYVLTGTWDKQEVFKILGNIQAQYEAEKQVQLPAASELTNFLLDAWVRDHAKTDEKSTGDVSETQFEEAAKGGFRPDLFVDQCYKEWEANGLEPPEDLRAEYAAFSSKLPQDSADVEGAQAASLMVVRGHFQDKSWSWAGADVKLEGFENHPEAQAYCTPVLDSGKSGVYVKEWKWRVHFRANEEDKEEFFLGDDQQVDDPQLPAECEPGTFQDAHTENGRYQGPSCEVTRAFDVWVEASAEPGAEKINKWTVQQQLDLGPQPADTSEERSWKNDDP